MNHLFVTQDYGPDRGGMARRHVELCRRFSDNSNRMTVSTVANAEALLFDAKESYSIDRQSFSFAHANRFANQIRWGHSLIEGWKGNVDVLHCGNIRPVGYAVQWAHRRLKVPYLLYVNGGDLLRERAKASNPVKKIVARNIFSRAAGIVATSSWVAGLSSSVMSELGVQNPPAVAAIGLGTDPEQFNPSKDSGALRKLWGVGDAPIMLTVARLVPHKGQDTGLRVLAELHKQFPELRYVLVGDGHYEGQLRRLAAELGVAARVIFAGDLSDADLAEAYATSNIYVGLSRIDKEVNAEGFGISFLEAAASALPSVAGNSGGVGSAVRDNETGFLVPPMEVLAAAEKVRMLLTDANLQQKMGSAGREAVESYYNWDRVARDTREFTTDVVLRAEAQ